MQISDVSDLRRIVKQIEVYLEFMQVNKGRRCIYGIYTSTILCKIIQLEDIFSYNYQLKIKNIPHITEVVLVSNLFPFSYVLLVSLYSHVFATHFLLSGTCE